VSQFDVFEPHLACVAKDFAERLRLSFSVGTQARCGYYISN
jgi:hypothetical protein